MPMTIEEIDPALLNDLAQNFSGDVWSIIEDQLPLPRCVISPRKHNSTLTFSELQQCMSVMLFHCASKAQRLGYTQGYEAINSCFKHFMYLCSHVHTITPQAALDIVNGIDDILSQSLTVFNPTNVTYDPALKESNSSTVRAAISHLDSILVAVVNKR